MHLCLLASLVAISLYKVSNRVITLGVPVSDVLKVSQIVRGATCSNVGCLDIDLSTPKVLHGDNCWQINEYAFIDRFVALARTLKQ